MKLHSYIVTHDTGFSPNPFWGFCTLADCKPAIRRTAKEGDWAELQVGRGHKNRFSQGVVPRFLQFIAAQDKGISGPPTKWPSDDESWRLGQG